MTMRIYLAYKYRNVQEKPKLIEDLKQISDYINSIGHKPFILGRDIQNWVSSTPLWKTVPHIFFNLLRSDIVLAYVENNAKSIGLSFELQCAKLLGKKIVMAVKKGLKQEELFKMADEIIYFENLDELKPEIKERIPEIVANPKDAFARS